MKGVVKIRRSTRTPSISTKLSGRAPTVGFLVYTPPVQLDRKFHAPPSTTAIDKTPRRVLQGGFAREAMGMAGPEEVPQRGQFVKFVFYKGEPAWRRLPGFERTQGKQEMIRAVVDYAGNEKVIPY